MSNWIETYRGRRVDVFRPEASEIDIVDIAHALAQTPRFRGMTTRFYGVAQHCVNVVACMMHAGYKYRRELVTGLLHDAAEAYLGDLPTPIKAGLPEFAAVEDHLLAAVLDRFDGIYPLPESVHAADALMLHLEAEALMPWNSWSLRGLHAPAGVDLQSWSVDDAEAEFSNLFYRLR